MIELIGVAHILSMNKALTILTFCKDLCTGDFAVGSL